MVARTAKFLGLAYSTGSTITVEVEYNGAVAYSGTVAATTQDPVPFDFPGGNYQELFSIETDTDTTGQIPVKITVTGGALFFENLQMNHVANAIPQQNNPSIPVNRNDPSTFTLKPVSVSDWFDTPSVLSAESDNISNTKKNGSAWPWRTENILCYWTYPIHDGEILEFDYFVDPTRVVVS
jgi:hypothetical protein